VRVTGTTGPQSVYLGSVVKKLHTFYWYTLQ